MDALKGGNTMDSFQTVYVFAVYSPSDDEPEVRMILRDKQTGKIWR